MKILTLWEPYATLMAIGAKTIETRSWYTSYRGPLAIHAARGGSKNYLYPAKMDGTLHLFDTALEGVQVMPGHIVGVVNLLDCCPMEHARCLAGVFTDYPELDTPKERAFGDYSPGRWAWVTEDHFRLPEPIAYKGGQGLRDLDHKIVQQIMAQGWREA